MKKTAEEMELLANKICKEELGVEPSELNLSFRKAMVHGMNRWEEYRSQSELPSDDRMIVEILNKIVKHSKRCRINGHGVVVALANECLALLSDRSSNLLLASRDARILELEKELDRINQLNKHYYNFRNEILEIDNSMIAIIDDKYFPF